MHRRSKSLAAFAAAMTAVAVSPVGSVSGEWRSPRVEKPSDVMALPFGWVWTLEPVDIRDGSKRPLAGNRMFWDSAIGLVRLLPGEREDEVIVERIEIQSSRSAPEDQYIVSTMAHVFVQDGDSLRRVISHGGALDIGRIISVNRSVFKVPGGIENVAMVGASALTLEGDRARNALRRERAWAAMDKARVRVLPPPILGEPFEHFEIDTLDHGPLNMEDLRGNVVLFQIWRSDCVQPMVDEHMRALARKHTLDGLIIIGVNHDFSVEAARDAIQEQKFVWPQIHAASVSGTEHYELWQTVAEHTGFPYHTLIGRDGRVIGHGALWPDSIRLEHELGKLPLRKPRPGATPQCLAR